MAQLVSRISGFFSSNPTVGDAKPTQRYLELAKKCMERVQKLILPDRSPSPKLYVEQCKYLANKLTSAIESADSFLELLNRGYYCFPAPEDTAYCLEIFMLLYALAKGVENFVLSCCRDAWIQTAVTWRNVSEHIASLSFNLELWIVVFSESTELRARRSLTLTEVGNVFKFEVEIVKQKASLDREVLLRNLDKELQIRKSTSDDYKLVVHLLDTCREHSLQASHSSPSDAGMKSLERKESLGKGSAGTAVYKAKWLGVDVAQKTFYIPNSPYFEKEVANLEGLSHSNITSLLSYAKGKRDCSIIMELMDEDLFSLIQRRFHIIKTREFPFGILEGVEIMLQIGEGMDYLYRKRIVHRDLKSMNILVKCVKSRDVEVEYVLVKVADFGLSKTKENSITNSIQSVNTGTNRWMAPELIKFHDTQSEAEMSNGKETNVKHPFKSDVYSFGMVCYEILTGELPFASTTNVADVKKMVLNGVRPPLPYECPSSLKQLIQRCWSPDPSKRPYFADICSELRHLKFLLLMPSGSRNHVSPALNESMQPSASYKTAKSIPIAFKKETCAVQWLVGLDIGTTFSGFAYAMGSHLHRMNVHYAFPYAEQPYYRTLTALNYKRLGPGIVSHSADSWGHLAYDSSQQGFYVPNFKLLLRKDLHQYPSRALGLPYPITMKSLIMDYLKHIGELALTQIKNCGGKESFSRDSVQWCVTVPSSWNDSAKQQTKECMVKAGLVSAARVTDSVVVFMKSDAGYILLTPATFTPVTASE